MVWLTHPPHISSRSHEPPSMGEYSVRGSPDIIPSYYGQTEKEVYNMKEYTYVHTIYVYIMYGVEVRMSS